MVLLGYWVSRAEVHRPGWLEPGWLEPGWLEPGWLEAGSGHSWVGPGQHQGGRAGLLVRPAPDSIVALPVAVSHWF